ncbi:MAG TPA: LacI family DNA-binding transcriptional regulator [Propionibacteriaceae bacterium]|nr:LacI family DNA-binding transcriptional regulator [Propionibacteriaceae bacterium]
MRATVRDVARRAGVSPKTVSNVVNGTFPVSPSTRSRVEAALAELDYVPNLSARGLRNGRTGVIALALPDLATAYSAEMAHNFVEAAAQRGLSIQIEETGGGAEREQQLLSRARAQLVDGLVLNPVLLETSAVQTGVPLPPTVLIGEVDQPIADHVWIDNITAIRQMVELLVAQGHRRIAVLGAMETESARLRLTGYRQALDAAGIPRRPELEIRVANWDPGGGADGMRAFLADNPCPEAVVCFTDSMAVGALSVLWSAGFTVPGDVSVTGYDDVAEARFTVPALTTVSFDKRLLSETALRLLADRIADNARPNESVTLPHTIVQRASTRIR